MAHIGQNTPLDAPYVIEDINGRELTGLQSFDVVSSGALTTDVTLFVGASGEGRTVARQTRPQGGTLSRFVVDLGDYPAGPLALKATAGYVSKGKTYVSESLASVVNVLPLASEPEPELEAQPVLSLDVSEIVVLTEDEYLALGADALPSVVYLSVKA